MHDVNEKAKVLNFQFEMTHVYFSRIYGGLQVIKLNIIIFLVTQAQKPPYKLQYKLFYV